jgi:hypothetical protein
MDVSNVSDSTVSDSIGGVARLLECMCGTMTIKANAHILSKRQKPLHNVGGPGILTHGFESPGTNAQIHIA